MWTNAANTNFCAMYLLIYLFIYLQFIYLFTVYLIMSVSQKKASNNRMTCEK